MLPPTSAGLFNAVAIPFCLFPFSMASAECLCHVHDLFHNLADARTLASNSPALSGVPFLGSLQGYLARIPAVLYLLRILPCSGSLYHPAGHQLLVVPPPSSSHTNVSAGSGSTVPRPARRPLRGFPVPLGGCNVLQHSEAVDPAPLGAGSGEHLLRFPALCMRSMSPLSCRTSSPLFLDGSASSGSRRVSSAVPSPSILKSLSVNSPPGLTTVEPWKLSTRSLSLVVASPSTMLCTGACGLCLPGLDLHLPLDHG